MRERDPTRPSRQSLRADAFRNALTIVSLSRPARRAVILCSFAQIAGRLMH
jgi:hypothetical protein